MLDPEVRYTYLEELRPPVGYVLDRAVATTYSPVSYTHLSVRVNPPENARLTFDHVVSDRLQDMVETNFKFYKRVTDDHQFSKYFLDWLFDRFLDKHNQNKS